MITGSYDVFEKNRFDVSVIDYAIDLNKEFFQLPNRLQLWQQTLASIPQYMQEEEKLQRIDQTSIIGLYYGQKERLFRTAMLDISSSGNHPHKLRIQAVYHGSRGDYENMSDIFDVKAMHDFILNLWGD